MIWNRERECMSRDELAVLQGKRLVKLVGYMYRNAGYYKKKMRARGLEPGDIRGIDDLPKLPFTTREDLIDAYPIGVFAMPDRKIIHYNTSNHRTGYIGMETIAGYTQKDIEIWKECMARSISMAGLGKKDVIQIAYSYGLCAEGLGAHYGAGKVGATVIPAADCKPATLVALMRRLRVTGVVSTSSQMMRVARIVKERGMRDRLQLKAAICGEDSWTESTRKILQDRLGISAYQIYGLNELTGLGVACECERQKGMHIQEDFYLAEIVDTHTLLAIPGGICGELVFTTLQKEGIPLIRFRTGSMAKINYEKCECGRTMAKMDKIDSEPDDILLFRGRCVSVSRMAAALEELKLVETSYLICVRTEQNIDVLDVYVENAKMNGTLLSENRTEVKRQVADAVGRVVKVAPRVHCVGSGEARTSGEASVNLFKMGNVTIVDERCY